MCTTAANCTTTFRRRRSHPPARRATRSPSRATASCRAACCSTWRGLAVSIRCAPAGRVITPADLDAAEQAQGVHVDSGDVLLIRTGHITVFTTDGYREGYMRQMPGLGIASVERLH